MKTSPIAILGTLGLIACALLLIWRNDVGHAMACVALLDTVARAGFTPPKPDAPPPPAPPPAPPMPPKEPTP
jgi:hypothetical protein